MIWIAQVILVLLLIPWVLKSFFPSLISTIKKEDLRSYQFMFLLLWVYSKIRIGLWFLDYIPFFPSLEFIVLALLTLRAKQVLIHVQMQVSPYQSRIETLWNVYKTYWETKESGKEKVGSSDTVEGKKVE